MLVSAALVLMMTGPGSGAFLWRPGAPEECARHDDAELHLDGVITVLWACCGYSLAFGEGSPFIGDLRYVFLNGVGGDPNADYAATIPQQTFMVYQLMFAIITPALISGAFAERMKFSAMVLFMIALARSSCTCRWRTWCGARAAS